MLYQIKDGTVSAGGQTILSHIDFYIKEKEKIAVVGKNGAGKTTLLRLLAGELTPDRDDSRGSYGRSNDMVTGAATAGSDLDGTAKRTQRAKKKKPSGNPETGITMSRNITIDMLRQADKSNQDLTIEQILLESCPDKDTFSKERFDYEMEYDRLFTGFGFEKSDKTRLFRSFSGGEQTKISLIKLLLKKPDLLLLDEPTNHLDMKTVEWLEDYLINYPKAVVMVSHDRAFLDAVATGVYELENGALHRYAGNYTQYRQQKLKNLQIQRKAYERQQAEIAHNNELIEKFKHKPKKAAFARSRKTMLARMKLIEKPVEDEAHIFTGNIEPQFPGGKWVYEAKELKIGYDGRALLELSLRIRRGQKIAVIGDNGIGKSTFLKTVAGLILPIKGTSQLGSNLLVGYFDQQSALIDSDKTVRDHFHELFPALVEKDLRKTLGMYLFGGANASKRISSLSGGEKSRLVLAELLTGRPNLMILDEPTNHMDIPAKETLESAFKAYTGTMLFVSHDRYFIKQVADAILVFENDKVMYYPFGYDHYISRLKASQDGNLPALMQAKDAAMVEALAAVPKRERHETRQLSTDEAYLEWKLTLAAEPMMKAADEAEKVYEELCEAEIALKAEMLRSCDFCEKISCGNNLAVEDKSCDISNGKLNQNIINTDTTKENVDKLRLQYEKVADSWTNECTKWYDIYLDEMYPESDF
jgi:ATP-binding cassette subfamily F protein 3